MENYSNIEKELLEQRVIKGTALVDNVFVPFAKIMQMPDERVAVSIAAAFRSLPASEIERKANLYFDAKWLDTFYLECEQDEQNMLLASWGHRFPDTLPAAFPDHEIFHRFLNFCAHTAPSDLENWKEVSLKQPLVLLDTRKRFGMYKLYGTLLNIHDEQTRRAIIRRALLAKL